MRIGTKSLLDCRSSRLVSGLSTPWALVHHHLSRLWTRLLRHPAFPLVHQLFPVRTSWYFYDLLYIFISAMQIAWTEAPWNTRLHLLLLLFIDVMRGLGRHMWGEISSLSWGKETNNKYTGQSRNTYWSFKIPIFQYFQVQCFMKNIAQI